MRRPPSHTTTESRVPAFSLGAGALLLALASVFMLVAWAPAQAQDAAPAQADKTASLATSAPANPSPAAEPQGLSAMPGSTDDSGWLAMLLVGGIVAATILNRQGR